MLIGKAVHKDNLRHLVIGVLALVGLFACAKEQPSQQAIQPVSDAKPNFVWLVSEDNSVHYLDMYDDGGAPTPAIAQLAEKGLVFNRAYSNAPVCSVARTTLQTGVYAPKLGVQLHRAASKVAPPENVRLVQEYLRDAGYYVTNKSKTDYNLNAIVGEVWDESSNNANWRNRANAEQPFFHMQSFSRSHEGRLHFGNGFYRENKDKYDLTQAQLPAYFPDTDLFRFTKLYYNSLITDIDNQVAEVVDKLDEDGLLDNTFIFYFGDHGGVLPRGKGYLYEAGVHIPLVVHVPKNFKHLVADFDSDRVDGIVEFVDFAPTLLNLAGLSVPSYIDGEAFLGKGVTFDEVQKRNASFSYADRMDEKYDLVRAITTPQFQYVRSYQPYLPDGMHSFYRYRMKAYEEWQSLYEAGELTPAQQQFFEPKPVEMLFDLNTDPDQVHNLAGDPEYAETLKQLRAQLIEQEKSLPDLGFIPESYYASDKRYKVSESVDISALIDIANLQLLTQPQATPKIVDALNSQDPLKVYWALTAALSFDTIDSATRDALAAISSTSPNFVMSRYAELLGKFALENPIPLLTSIINTDTNAVAVLEALNALTYVVEYTEFALPKEALQPSVEVDINIQARLDYLQTVAIE